MDALKEWIKKCEGYRSHPYLDSVGKVTIGWGHNLDNGIPLDVADMLLDDDIKQVKQYLLTKNWYVIQPPGVQMAIENMCFNLGIYKLLTFYKMINALCIKDYTTAALEALDSKWATQVGERAKDVAIMIREGK